MLLLLLLRSVKKNQVLCIGPVFGAAMATTVI